MSGERDGSTAGTQGLSSLTGSHGVSLGTGTSLLERLMLHNPLYKRSSGGYNQQFVTKLLWNYRWGWGQAGMRDLCLHPRLQQPSASQSQLVRKMGMRPLSWVHVTPTLGTVLPLPGPMRPSSGSPTSSSMTAS